ncbi:YeeE/YedE family protein [Rheinheimera oceanensis]|uniref:YeeE/YedE family protein n=1 Tax=Rheinheimera oceanensis TaxID=2817449 RepID=UPI001BFE068E|nr:YeeE/YedE family protein [Rheinheimera oceanensis]
MENFTPVEALIGGALIGLGALILFVFYGRIAGISGIAGSALFVREGRSWRLAFVAGIVAGPILVDAILTDFSYATPQLSWQVIAAGLLVGVGTGWGSGCTSGHGICGISRLSPRSVTATVLFMLSGMLVATLLH